MKKKLMLLATLAMCSVTTLANNQLGLNIYLGGGVNFKDNDRDYSKIISSGAHTNPNPQKRKEFIRGYSFNVDITKNVGDYIELGVGTGYIHNKQYTYDFKHKSSATSPETTKNAKVFAIDNVPLYATAKVKFSKGNIKPYIKADLGYAFNVKYKHFKYADTTLDHTGDIHINNKLEDHGGVYIGGAIGVEAYNFFVEAKASHIFNDVTVNYSENGLTTYPPTGSNASDTWTTFKGNTLLGIRAGYKFEF